MNKSQNENRIPLAVAVWLATDTYDYNDDPYTISATTLIKPIKEIVLSARVPEESKVSDIANSAASSIGTAIHDSIESSWVNNHKQAMADLGYPKKVIDKIRINPTDDELSEDILPVYMEQRLTRKVGKWTVTGKFDFLAQGRVEDFKTTGVYTYIKKTSDKKYKMQGSIYRFLDPKKITEPTVMIHFIFLDWKAYDYMRDKKNYPPMKIMGHPVPLMGLDETEEFVTNKLAEIDQYRKAKEDDIPPCTPEDLWQDEVKYKYYKNPASTGRSTKNFTNLGEANLRLAQDGGVGIVVTDNGQVRACKYCSAFPVCKQKDGYIASGMLKV